MLAVAVFGRALASNTTNGTPLIPPAYDSMTTPEGVLISVHVEGVRAQDVYDVLLANGLQPGLQLALVEIVASGDTAANIGGGKSTNEDGTVSYFALPASIQINVDDWLSNADLAVSRAYGRVWANYYKWKYWEGRWDAYLQARGIFGDPRLGPDAQPSAGDPTCWNAEAIISEDYRQLFGSPQVQPMDHCNSDLPLPNEVVNFPDFLALTWTSNHPPPNYSSVGETPDPDISDPADDSDSDEIVESPVPPPRSMSAPALPATKTPTRTPTPRTTSATPAGTPARLAATPTATSTLVPTPSTSTPVPMATPPLSGTEIPPFATPPANGTVLPSPPAPPSSGTAFPPTATPPSAKTAVPATATPLPTGTAVPPPSQGGAPPATATIDIANGWRTFVAPISGHTNQTVYTDTGKKSVATNQVAKGNSYRVNGPLTLVITAN